MPEFFITATYSPTRRNALPVVTVTRAPESNQTAQVARKKKSDSGNSGQPSHNGRHHANQPPTGSTNAGQSNPPPNPPGPTHSSPPPSPNERRSIRSAIAKYQAALSDLGPNCEDDKRIEKYEAARERLIRLLIKVIPAQADLSSSLHLDPFAMHSVSVDGAIFTVLRDEYSHEWLLSVSNPVLI